MSAIQNKWSAIPLEVQFILAIIFGVLLVSTLVFSILSRVSSSKISGELWTRTKSWWIISMFVLILATAPLWLRAIVVAFMSFVSLREMLTISPMRATDRPGLFFSYFVIPVQYFFAWGNYYDLFLIFVPFIVFISIPFVLVIGGNMIRIGRSMAIITSILLLTVFLLSHVIMIIHLGDHHKFASGSGLVMFLIVLTAFNDVFQFIWGKLFGRHKIMPRVSPNKTWEGFIGGILTTSAFGCLLRFLTPFDLYEAMFLSFCIGVFGFIGDVLISAIKRDLKLKDTSNLLPGHGGIMDRLDSLFVTAPVFFHLAKQFIG